MKLVIVNGPNLNLLGQRETSIYGNQTFEHFFQDLVDQYISTELDYMQSNIEGELINYLHNITADGIILNAGGYTHTSVALADAIAGITTPVVEVHISNLYAREELRHVSLTGKHCVGVLTGFGLSGYQLAIDYFLQFLK